MMPASSIGMKPVILLLGLFTLLMVVFLLNVSIGSVNIPIEDVLRVLLGQSASKQSWTNIVLKFRLPRAVTAVLAGAALGVSGLTMQTFFRNPLAGPFILGINSGASLGVALVVLSVGMVGTTIITGIGLRGDLLIVAAAGLGAGLTMSIVLVIARKVESSIVLLIVGLMFGYMTGGIVTLLMYFSNPERIQSYINWTFGTFSEVTWGQMQIFVPVVFLGLFMALVLSKSLNALLLGESYAHSMGLNVQRTRVSIVVSTALLAGSVTAFCGPIGFIGIAVPHVARSLFNSSDHRLLVPATTLLGAVVALIAALISSVPGSQIVLPLNAVTALIGAPIVMWVILRSRNLRNAF